MWGRWSATRDAEPLATPDPSPVGSESNGAEQLDVDFGEGWQLRLVPDLPPDDRLFGPFNEDGLYVPPAECDYRSLTVEVTDPGGRSWAAGLVDPRSSGSDRIAVHSVLGPVLGAEGDDAVTRTDPTGMFPSDPPGLGIDEKHPTVVVAEEEVSIPQLQERIGVTEWGGLSVVLYADWTLKDRGMLNDRLTVVDAEGNEMDSSPLAGRSEKCLEPPVPIGEILTGEAAAGPVAVATAVLDAELLESDFDLVTGLTPEFEEAFRGAHRFGTELFTNSSWTVEIGEVRRLDSGVVWVQTELKGLPVGLWAEVIPAQEGWNVTPRSLCVAVELTNETCPDQ